MIRDRVVFGVRDVQLKERLLRGSPDITLEQVLGMCRATEATKIQMKTLKEEGKSVHIVNKSMWKGTGNVKPSTGENVVDVVLCTAQRNVLPRFKCV